MPTYAFQALLDWATRRSDAEIENRPKRKTPLVVYVRDRKVADIMPTRLGSTCYLQSPSDAEVRRIETQLSHGDLRLFRETGYSPDYIRFAVVAESDVSLVKELILARAHDSSW